MSGEEAWESVGEAPKMEVKKRTVSFNDDADVVVVARIPEQFSAPKTKKKNKPKKKKSPQQQSPSISPMPAGAMDEPELDHDTKIEKLSKGASVPKEEAERLLRGASWNVDRAFDAFYTAKREQSADEWETTAVVKKKKKKKENKEDRSQPQAAPLSAQQQQKRHPKTAVGKPDTKPPQQDNKRSDGASKPTMGTDGPAANKKANGKRTAIAAPNARPVKQQQRQGGPPVTYSITPMGGAPLGQKQPAKNTPPSPAMQQASATAPTTGNQHSNRISKPKATQPTNAPAAKAPSKQATVASQKNAASVRDLEKARLTKEGHTVSNSGMMQVAIPEHLRQLLAGGGPAQATMPAAMPVIPNTYSIQPMGGAPVIKPMGGAAVIKPMGVAPLGGQGHAAEYSSQHSLTTSNVDTAKELCQTKYTEASNNLKGVFVNLREHLQLQEHRLEAQLELGLQEEMNAIDSRRAQLAKLAPTATVQSTASVQHLKAFASAAQLDTVNWGQDNLFLYNHEHATGVVAEIKKIGNIHKHGANMQPVSYPAPLKQAAKAASAQTHGPKKTRANTSTKQPPASQVRKETGVSNSQQGGSRGGRGNQGRGGRGDRAGGRGANQKNNRGAVQGQQGKSQPGSVPHAGSKDSSTPKHTTNTTAKPQREKRPPRKGNAKGAAGKQQKPPSKAQ